MKARERIIPAFLTGGGKMGELISSFDWSKTDIGSADTWPQSLRTTLSILLNSKFPMFLWWGKDLIQFYNDAYRPSLGNDGKHPTALGQKGEDCWPEIWPTIKPLIDQVLEGGEATWSEDQLIPIYRNGKLENVYWTFSYSPVKKENGEVGGVLVTVIETTEKVNNLKKIAEGNDQLNLIFEATELGIWDYDPITNKVIGNNRFKDWFGFPHDEDLYISQCINVMAEQDRVRVSDAIQIALQYESGGLYNIEYGIINAVTKQERIVRAKGKVWFGDDKKAYRFNGTLQDITEQAIASRKIEESETKFRNLILQSPVLITTFRGPSFIVETINKKALELWGKSYGQVINKPIFEVSPELEDGLKIILNDVYTTGEPYISSEIPVQLKRTGKTDTAYFNSVYQPLRDLDNNIYGIILIGTEVTEAVEARKLIEASEQRLSDERMVFYNSFMNAPAGISILKGDTHIYEFANAEYEKLVDRKITPGKTVQELFPEIEQQGLIDILNNVFSTGEPFVANEFPVELIDKRTGKLVLRYYNSVIQPIKDEKGNIERLLSHGVEVTQQVEARKKIEASEQRFGAAVEAVQGILWTNNAKGEMEGEQKGWAALTAQSYDEYQGYGWATAVHPDDAQPTIEAWNEAVKEFKNFEFEHRVKTKSGKWELFSIKAIPLLNEDGSIREWIGVHTNITVQKEAEAKIKASEKLFRTFADSIQSLAWIANADGWIYWYNQQWYDYTGTNFEEMEGWGWEKVHHPDHVERVVNFVKEAWKKDKAFELTFPLRRYDGEYRWFLTQAYPVKDASGNNERWIGTNTDIHEQKIINDKKDEFISIASNEMRTPLTTAKGYIDLLLMKLGKGDETISLFASKANEGLNRLQDLVMELLDVSKLQNGKLQYNISTFDFNKMIDEAIENIQLGTKDHVIQKSGNSLQQVTGDRNRLQQVLVNLITNAIKYSPDANEILVNVEEKENILQVAIQDFGIGMSKQHLDKIFQRYYRVQEHAVHFQGLGIGLYISSEIIHDHKGAMWVESEPAKGSTFYFTLPL